MNKGTITVILGATAFIYGLSAGVESGLSHADEIKKDPYTVSEVRSARERYLAKKRLERLEGRLSGEVRAVLERVSPEKVDMAANRLGRGAIAEVKAGGKTYYVASEYASAPVSENKSFRYAKDPLTHNLVDKAGAEIYADASGRVFYFESESSYREFMEISSHIEKDLKGHDQEESRNGRD